MDSAEYTALAVYKTPTTTDDSWYVTLMLARNQQREKGWEIVVTDHTADGAVILLKKPAKALRVIMSATVK